jgi:hypothetical protein
MLPAVYGEGKAAPGDGYHRPQSIVSVTDAADGDDGIRVPSDCRKPARNP